MRYMKWAGIAAAILLVISCYSPWVEIESKKILVTGFHSAGTHFGEPGWFHLIMAVFFLAFTLIQKIWAKRANLLVTALNLGWAVRNYFIISGCEAGDCPVKKISLYLVLISSVLMLLSALFPDMTLRKAKK